MKPATAATPGDLDPKDLDLVLALVRGRTLGDAGRRLGQDTSTVYRAVKRLEQRLGLSLFDRSRHGMAPSELALALAQRAEAIEAELDRARELLRDGDLALTGTLRVTASDIVLPGLLMPLLPAFRQAYPLLDLELRANNQRASLDRREADVALRATARPPEHLVGVQLGRIRSAVWASRRFLEAQPSGTEVGAMTWAAPDADETLPDYPSKRWRRKHHPQVVPQVRCDGMLAVAQAVQAGLAVGVAPYFLMAGRPDLVDLSGHLSELDIDLWLLTHPDVRHLRRVKVFFEFVRERLVLA
jgi:DNA-binding transcriptional LysR family regulator